jgi:FixJ family two-component response regulator
MTTRAYSEAWNGCFACIRSSRYFSRQQRTFAARADFADACCILLDINLKKGSGIELRDRLAKAGISTPVIFMTGNTDERTKEKALEVGCVKYLKKPFPAQELLQPLKELCSAA